MSGCARRKVSTDPTKSFICDLPTEILHGILEIMPIKYAARTGTLSKQWRQVWSTQPHLVFDPLFFQYVYNKGASAASVIHKILTQHIGNILGFHLISKTDTLSQSDVDQFINFVSDHGIQKLTLDMANDEKYALPDSIFTCATLTHLKLWRCIFKLPDGTQFPNLVSLQLEHSAIDSPVGSKNTTLILPMLETLELKFCVDVDSVDMVSPKLVNLSILSSYTVTFECFNVNPIFERIKHLCLDGSSLKVAKLLTHFLFYLQYFNLQHKISVKRITCALCILRNSPNLIELDIDKVVKEELFDYLSKAKNEVREALRMIRTVRLRKFKGKTTEMYLIEAMLAHSPKLERMIVEQCKKTNATNDNQHLKELGSYHRASPNAEIKYT
ncbi:F-box/FBD/LRR-repeat protein At1g13570-like [Lycium ferocissimum]|uniref:F-box/FBD/LRR-repeat protein At1g13570-like n=1 Tax=Lycium ferocissimum TaxID=112874 RepID=UPI002815562A|nr:F-box/FBD/LRR-repeat protein At1g13570-like [Lycium ferocissimum]